MTDFDLLQQRLNLANALKERPDAFARRTKIAAALQKPPGLINADDENLYDVDSTMRALDGRPVLLKTIRDNSAFAKLAHDDFERLANIEHLATLKQERLRREREANRPWFMHGALDEAWANIRKIPKAAWAGKNDKEVEDLRYTLQELEKAGTLTEEGRARIEADIKIHENQRDAAFEEIADINRSIADNSPEDLNIWQKMGRGAVTSLPQMAAAAGITMVSRNPTLGALAMGYGVKETSTAEARIAGLDYDAAQRKGMIDGAAEAAFEILPLGKMMGLYGRGAAQEGRATLKELGKTVASEVAGENATQLIQDANNLWHGLDPVWQKAIAEHGLFSPESLKIQGERQLIASGAAALTSGTLSAPALIANMRRSQEQDITNLTAMTDAARASKLNQRAPDVFRGWTEQIEENADIQHYYVDGNALHQSGLVAALEEALPDRVGEIRQALATGGTVQIPAADILTKIAPDKGLEDAITPHLRTADGLSLHELETTGQAELEGAITENAARAEQAAAQQTETDAIRDDFAAQLTATGRITRDAALQNAELPAAFYQTVAERLGISVSEAYEKYKLKVVGEPLVGLNQPMTQGFQWEFGQRRGLFGMADIPVTEISGKELGQDERAIRTNLNEHLKVYAEGGLTNRDTGWDLRISSEDRKKLAKWFGATLPSLQSQAALEEIVENAVLAESHPDSRHENSDVIGIHRLYAPVSIDGKLHRAKLTVRDYQSKSTGDKTRLRRLEAIEIENAPMGTLPMPEANLQTTAQPTSGRLSLSVRELLRDSKRDDGTAWDFTDNTLHQNADAGSKRGAFDPDTNTIALLEKADLSTFIHELGHFYFETLTRIANDLRARDNAAGGGTLTEGEIRLLKDADTLLGKAELTLDDWNQMTLKERRSHHENIARQFEAYLMEGKAPSVELQGIFSRLRSWLFAVYKKLTALNVQLDDDVRQVFDRLLASDEAIQIAEQNRSMMPLFSTPEAVGMTAEQFADYQRQFQGASDAALDEMSLRMLADAKAIGRLKHKALKAKDKEAKILRGETEIEARRAIMAQPVYRVWQMLTGKMNADTTIASNKRPWTDDVAPEHDDLFTAIAKLGGINRSDIESTWGFDPADKISPVKPGFFVLRREGGQSLDGMRQALVQYGYLTESDSLNDFYEVFEAQRRGDTQYSNRHQPDPGVGKTGEHAHLHDLPAFRLDYASLAEMGYDDAQIATLGRKVKKKGGIHPDLLAELVMDADGNPVYDSGDALVQALLAAPEPKTAVRELTDRIMLERHGELATPEAIGEAADMAAHNDLRLRVLATEYNALAQASGGARLVQSAARQLAAQAIGQKRIRDLSPAQYTRMETRAAKAAQAAMKKGDIATAAAEKRNQVLQASLARAAHEAKVETKKHALYLRRMNKLDPKTVAIEEREQIEALLERYNLRDQSGKALDRRQSLAEWVQAQREQGIEPDIAPEMLDELKRQPWQTLTVDELRGLVDTVRQIEHRGRTKNELLTARKKEDYNTAIENMVASIDAHARVSGIENRTPTTKAGKAKAAVGRFFAAHLKTAMLARRFDGNADGGAVWEYFIRPANAAADQETMMRAEATARLSEILAPRIHDRAANRKKSYTIAGKTRSFTHNDIFVMALNRGNEGNLQRLLGGENWEETDLAPLLAELTAADWQAVQAIWDYFETFRPAIAAKERRVNGVEPQWVAPTPFTVRSADGQIVEMRGGYYPIRYDTQASERAAEDDAASAVQAQMRGVHSAATTRRGHTKSRVQEVHNRPLVYNFAGIYSGFSDVIHDLAWHEYLIDANKLLRSTRLQNAVKDHYGTDVLRQFKTWIQDIAVGDNEALAAGEDALRTVRRYASMAGLAFNVVSALKQPLGILQSVARVGGQDVLAATAQFIRNPVAMTREAQGASVFMKNRARTRFRELNELRNALEQQNTIRQAMGRYGYVLIMAVQQQVDVITWHAQLNKSLRVGADIQDAVAHADQAVIDSQGSGMLKDLAAIERGGEWRKLFTVYYGFMNTVLNLEVNALTAKRSLGYKAGTVLMLSVAMPIIDAALSDLLKPGDSDDWDEDHWQASVGKAVANSLTGHFFALRELQFGGRSYSGPTGTRSIADAYKLIEQTRQGELDDGFRRALINIAGSWYGLPSAQINRSWDGFEALDDGKTDNPLALIFGYQEKK
nr:MAG TPA: crystallin beta/gamma motif-containing protein [Caudoviricetes sp.]